MGKRRDKLGACQHEEYKMDTEKILSRSLGTPEHTESVSFRLTAEDKRRLLELCDKRGLSVGRLMRSLVEEFLNEI